jgi:uncharacterized protein
LKFVIDTNVWVSGLIWGGKPRQVIELTSMAPHEIYSCAALVQELRHTLSYARLQPYLLARQLNAQSLCDQITLVAHLQPPATLKQPVCRDPADDVVLACALAAQADYIVSGDQDLLTLKSFESITILTVDQALQRLLV